MRQWFILTILFILLAACSGARPDTPTLQRSINLEPCQLGAPGLPARVEARCGTLSVPEDRANPNSRQISLRLAVLPAVRRDPLPDPLVLLAGGPGQAATEAFVALVGAFDQIRRDRDIVLVDQRGTGGSHPLKCSTPDEQPGAGLTSDAELTTWLADCLKNLDADPRLYTTSIAMDDLDAVRAALGYETVNLYGVSYGTRAALTYLRQYPQRVRAVVLDGVAPPDWPLGLTVGRDAQRALDLVFDGCAADPACQKAFPNLRDSFNALLQGLERQPVTLTLPHPRTGEPTELRLTRDMVALAVRLLSYSPETVALLPLLIHTARQSGDLSALAAQYLIVADQLGGSITAGMGYSVQCAEDMPAIDPAEAARVNAGAYLGTTVIDQLRKVCAVWPAGAAPANSREPVRSDVPTLLLSGGADPVTPPENGERAARTLPNSLHIVAPGQGHNVVFRGCIPRIVTTFINQGTVSGLDTACVQTLGPAPFFTSPSGPTP